MNCYVELAASERLGDMPTDSLLPTAGDECDWHNSPNVILSEAKDMLGAE
jgi:hypothetical protein